MDCEDLELGFLDLRRRCPPRPPEHWFDLLILIFSAFFFFGSTGRAFTFLFLYLSLDSFYFYMGLAVRLQCVTNVGRTIFTVLTFAFHLHFYTRVFPLPVLACEWTALELEQKTQLLPFRMLLLLSFCSPLSRLGLLGWFFFSVNAVLVVVFCAFLHSHLHHSVRCFHCTYTYT